MICKNHESGKYQALAMCAVKKSQRLKNPNLVYNYPPIPGREGGYCVIEEFKGTSAACVPCPGMSSVWMLVWEWGQGPALTAQWPRLSGAWRSSRHWSACWRMRTPLNHRIPRLASLIQHYQEQSYIVTLQVPHWDDSLKPNSFQTY